MKTLKDLADYYKWRDNMKTGDLLLWRSNSVLGKLIRWFSKADVNHAGLVFHFNEFKDLKNRRIIIEALEKGLEPSLLSERLEIFDGNVWWYALKDEFDPYRNRIGDWATQQAFQYPKPKYDYGSLFKQAVARVSCDARNFFCSEYCYMVWFEAAGYPLVPLVEHAPRPGDLPALGIFKQKQQIL